MTTMNETTPAPQLSSDLLKMLFSIEGQTFDMEKGTVVTNADSRVIYLSSDMIHSIYDTLKYEAGDAWSLILKNCGVVWGKRINRSLEKELQLEGRQQVGSLAVDSYLKLLESYFSSHGWGKLRIYMDDAESHGIVRVSLLNSLFAQTLKDQREPVDFMIAGMLQSIFSDISSYDLRCIQVSYQYSGNNCSEFLISGPARIAALEQVQLHDLSIDDVLAQLRVTG